jgi:ribosomal protein S18 acetylase RimI-like enzyme
MREELIEGIRLKWCVELSATTRSQLIRIYEDSFPPEERVSFPALIQGVGAGQRQLLTAETGRDLLGFATVIGFPALAVTYLEFLAVAPEQRNRGCGGAMMGFMLRSLSERGFLAIIFEVESDVEIGASDRDLRRRRIRFYERNGATLIHCAPDYRAPNLNGGDAMPMRLMWLPMDPLAPSPSGQILKQWIVAMYAASYSRVESDPLLRSVLAELIC